MDYYLFRGETTENWRIEIPVRVAAKYQEFISPIVRTPPANGRSFNLLFPRIVFRFFPREKKKEERVKLSGEIVRFTGEN